VGRLVELGLQSSSADTLYERGFFRAFDSYGRMLYQRDRLSNHNNGDNLSNQVSFTYDPLTGLPLKMIDREIEQAPGEFGPLTPGGSHVTRIYETHLQHDLLDRVTRIDQMPEGLAGDPVSHKYFHDSLGSLVRFQDTLTAELQWVFDGLGDVRARTEKGVLGGLITTTTDIDYVTGLVTRTDAENRVSRFYHDKAWRLDKQELPGAVAGSPSFSHDFVYDAASRLTNVINGNGANITREYDAAGRLKKQWVWPTQYHSIFATKEEYDYNDYGNEWKARTYASAIPNEVLLAEVWLNEDGFGRRTSETFMFGWFLRNVGSLYTVAGGAQDFLARRGVHVTDTPDVARQLDGLGRTWQYGGATAGNPDEWVARYRYVGRRVRERQQGKQTTDAWLLTADHEWDSLRRLDKLTTNRIAGNVQLSRFEHTFDIEGHLKKRKRDRIGGTGQPAGAGDWFKLDEYYRLAGAKLGVSAAQFGGDNNTDAQFNAVTSYQRSIDYSPAAGPLDKAQNRHLVNDEDGGVITSTAYAVNANSHRYDSVGGVPLVYDNEGNLVFDGTYRYVYDFKNRLSEVYLYVPAQGEQALSSGTGSRSASGARTRPRYLVPRERLDRIYARGRDRFAAAMRTREGLRNLGRTGVLADQNSSTAVVEGNYEVVAFYGYDPFNRRIIRALANEPPIYSTWDSWREVAEYSSANNSVPAIRNFVWGNRLDEMIRYSRRPVGVTTWEHFYPQQDHQESVDMLVDGSGVPKEKCEYDPFGNVRVFTWDSGTGTWNTTWAYTSSVGNPYLFTGRRFDVETGIGYYRNRYYSPNLGRFLTGDALGLWEDQHAVGNPYQYSGNSPAFLLDPYGLQITSGQANAALKNQQETAGGSGYSVTVHVNPPGGNPGAGRGSTWRGDVGHAWLELRAPGGNRMSFGLYSGYGTLTEERGSSQRGGSRSSGSNGSSKPGSNSSARSGSSGSGEAVPVINPNTNGHLRSNDRPAEGHVSVNVPLSSDQFNALFRWIFNQFTASFGCSLPYSLFPDIDGTGENCSSWATEGLRRALGRDDPFGQFLDEAPSRGLSDAHSPGGLALAILLATSI
jgi:RHS repeat-associated protein